MLAEAVGLEPSLPGLSHEMKYSVDDVSCHAQAQQLWIGVHLVKVEPSLQGLSQGLNCLVKMFVAVCRPSSGSSTE